MYDTIDFARDTSTAGGEITGYLIGGTFGGFKIDVMQALSALTGKTFHYDIRNWGPASQGNRQAIGEVEKWYLFCSGQAVMLDMKAEQPTQGPDSVAQAEVSDTAKLKLVRGENAVTSATVRQRSLRSSPFRTR